MLAGTSAFAQQTEAPRTKAKQRPTPEQMAQRMSDRMAQRYELTDAQKQQVYDLSLQQVQSMQEHRRQMVAERKAADEKMSIWPATAFSMTKHAGKHHGDKK